MKIGIPQALLYFYYGPFWKSFFERLGCKVVISETTNKSIINKGVKNSVPEICVPIKILVGHFLTLAKQNVDYIFVPRMVSIRKREFFCPKFMGLPDMVKHSLKLEEKLLSCDVESHNDNICNYKNYLPLADKIGKSKQEIKKTAKEAEQDWLKFRKITRLGYPAPKAYQYFKKGIIPPKIKHKLGQIRVGLISYVYNMYDPYISLGIFDVLEETGAHVTTFDMFAENELKEVTKNMEKVLFWTFSNRLLEAGLHLFNSDQVDGVIHLTAFGCGPDSFLGKLFELESDKTGVPFMTIRVDEHTGENHLITRVEAFTDMLKRSKAANSK
jgi:predicted nucleotide-binding protein (sugar kinase/HSP70/actin superfamily)